MTFGTQKTNDKRQMVPRTKKIIQFVCTNWRVIGPKKNIQYLRQVNFERTDERTE